MNVTYTGKIETFYPAQVSRLETKFARLARMLDGKGEKLAHVILTASRGIHTAELTVNYLDHSLVGVGSDPEQFTAITDAIAKLEKQARKVLEKRRGTKKGPREAWDKAATADAGVPDPEPRNNGQPRIYHVDPDEDRKPITLDQALLEIGAAESYKVYRDLDSDRLSILLRRPDGNFDLVES